jgi:hypothetical protein
VIPATWEAEAGNWQPIGQNKISLTYPYTKINSRWITAINEKRIKYDEILHDFMVLKGCLSKTIIYPTKK